VRRLNKIAPIFKKEIMNSVRDRRVLFSTVIIPLVVLPLVTMLPMMMIGNKQRQAQATPSSLALIGLKYDELEQELRASNRFVFMSSESVARDIRLNRLDAAVEVLSLPQGQNSAQIKLLYNATRTESEAASDKVKLVLADLSRRLLAREIDTTRVNLNPVNTILTNVASQQEMAGFYLGMVVGMMAVIGLVSGGMVMAIDSTAGEKERKTLEVLLAAPIARNEIVLGKYLATLLMGMVSVVLMTTGYTGSLLIGLHALGTNAGMGMSGLSISPRILPIILVVMLCVAGFVAALEMAIAIFARSYREAQTYLSSMTIIAVVPLVFMQILPANPGPSFYYIPLLNAMLLIRELLMGSVVTRHIVNTVASSLVFSALALRLAFSMFRRESVLLR
jgi:sodium transport system permease protein